VGAEAQVSFREKWLHNFRDVIEACFPGDNEDLQFERESAIAFIEELNKRQVQRLEGVAQEVVQLAEHGMWPGKRSTVEAAKAAIKCPHCPHRYHAGVSCLESDACECGQ
jgi:hypothetical protein